MPISWLRCAGFMVFSDSQMALKAGANKTSFTKPINCEL
jgi:hypothetical protein